MISQNSLSTKKLQTNGLTKSAQTNGKLTTQRNNNDKANGKTHSDNGHVVANGWHDNNINASNTCNLSTLCNSTTSAATNRKHLGDFYSLSSSSSSFLASQAYLPKYVEKSFR